MQGKQTEIPPATQKQIQYLIVLKVKPEEAEAMDIEQAAQAIAFKLEQRAIERRTPTVPQIKLLKKLGVPREDIEELDRPSATKLIGDILRRESERKAEDARGTRTSSESYLEEDEDSDGFFDRI